MKTCKICEKALVKNQKKYCSRTCHHKGLSLIQTAVIESKECEHCNVQYEFRPEWRSNANTKFCSRKCKDEHQKTKFLREGNPNFGREQSQEEKDRRSITLQRAWQDEDLLAKHHASLSLFREKHGYWPGTDTLSQEKKRKTCLERYGVSHPWKSQEIREKCLVTTKQRYGKSASHIAQELYKLRDSSIEKRIESILLQQQIEFVHPYYLEVEQDIRAFDFYLPNYDVLIEADGDYWHANPEMFESLNRSQSKSKKNDEMKNKMAKDAGIILLRFWETEINNPNFSTKLMEKLCLVK